MPIYPKNILSKLPHIGTTIFSVMSKLATESKAINLSQGFPDFECDRKLIELVYEKMVAGLNQYAPMQGLTSLRNTIANKFELLYNVLYDADTEITITAGGTQAIYSTVSAFINEGDECIVFTPAYDCYDPAVTLHKGVTRYIGLSPNDFSIDWKKVRETVNEKTKLIFINSPHNPCGSMLSENDLNELASIIKHTNIIVVSDEVYEHIIFDGNKHHSFCTHPDLIDRTVIIASFGKVFHVTGWKTGYMCAPANLMHEIRKAHQYQVFCVNAPLQHAFAEYLSDENSYKPLGEFYQEKRDYFLSGIKNSRFTFTPAKGTYFQLLDYSKITNENDVDFAKRLTTDKKIASIPVSVFYDKAPANQHLLRFCFAKKKETLDKAIEIINSI